MPGRYGGVVLVRRDGDAAVVIGQASHAWIAGQLARSWGNERFPAPEPREEVCLAAEQHDVGMAEWDVRPALNPETGLPRSFLELPVSVHVGLWSAAPAKLLSQSRYAALLVSMHGVALQGLRNLSRLDAPDRKLVVDYLASQRELQTKLAERVGADAQTLARNQRLVWTWDSMSLALCLGWGSTELKQVPGRDRTIDMRLENMAPDRFALDPWPFRRPELEVHCEGRVLEGRYDTEVQLHQALERADSVTLSFGLRPAADDGTGS
jgi:hypothetical protein